MHPLIEKIADVITAIIIGVGGAVFLVYWLSK